jgi:dCMP deaminase
MDSSNKRDKDYVDLCEFWANKKSKDPSTKTGAVIVNRDNEIISLGYNGFPRKTDDSPELYNDREIKYERIVHCEMNAILTARESLKDCVLYTWPFLSCPRCAAHVIQAGITKVIAPKCPADKLDRWGELLERSKKLFKEAGVEVIEL